MTADEKAKMRDFIDQLEQVAAVPVTRRVAYIMRIVDDMSRFVGDEELKDVKV